MDDIVTQLIMETERLREELETQNIHFQREIIELKENHSRQLKENEEHFLREYKAQQEHIEKEFNAEQKFYLDENAELRHKIYSDVNEELRQKFINESEITDILSNRIKILEEELERVKNILYKNKIETE
uniref:Uncharacterized protein n=1 Tax=viral metagenome TaxID=1070528 RepID=A0A6C0JIT9_9ZZZZ